MTAPHGDLALFTLAGVGPSQVPVPGEVALFDVIADRVILPDVPDASPLANTPRPRAE